MNNQNHDIQLNFITSEHYLSGDEQVSKLFENFRLPTLLMSKKKKDYYIQTLLHTLLFHLFEIVLVTLEN